MNPVRHFDPSRPSPALPSLHRSLVNARFAEVAKVPNRLRRLGAPVEPVRLARYLAGRPQLMDPTCAPGLYRQIEKWRAPSRLTLMDLFYVGSTLAESNVASVLRSIGLTISVEQLVAEGILRPTGPGLASNLRFVPCHDQLLITDPPDRSIPDYTYVGRDSLVFSEILASRTTAFSRALDLCCGSGIQALTIASQGHEVIGTDLNGRALGFARLNAQLHDQEGRVRFRQADLAADIDGPFDLVVANPPYVWMPEGARNQNLDGFGGRRGLEVVERIVADLDRLLADHGEAHLVCESPVINNRIVLAEYLANGPAGLAFDLVPLWLSIHPEFGEFQAAQGVDHSVYFHVRAHRDGAGGCRVGKLAVHKRLPLLAYVALARRRFQKGVNA